MAETPLLPQAAAATTPAAAATLVLVGAAATPTARTALQGSHGRPS